MSDSKIFVISDLHLGHNKDFVYAARGFQTVEQHDDAIVERWNSIVSNNDIVYVLGDLMLGDNKDESIERLKMLNGHIYVIYGNHDTKNKNKRYSEECGFQMLGYANMIKHKKLSIYLSHYPTITSNYDCDHFSQHVINLFGHTHSTEKFYDNNCFMYNVACDAHDCTPVLLDDVISEIKAKYEEMRGIMPMVACDYCSHRFSVECEFNRTKKCPSFRLSWDSLTEKQQKRIRNILDKEVEQYNGKEFD